jgi:SAM-dependent methyltransferase
MPSPLVVAVLDHPIRHILQNLVCHIPGASYLQKARTVTGAMNDPSVMAHWVSLVLSDIDAAGKTIHGARLVEIGPGHSLGIAFGLLAAGAKEIFAVDVCQYADLSDANPYSAAIDECKKRGLVQNEIDHSAKALASKLTYKLVDRHGRWPVDDASIDVAYSYFAGEHLRKPDEVLRETWRVLKPGGICIFAIDLEDHFHSDANWLQFLYYDKWLWEAMCSRRGLWTNRLRSPEWRDLFSKSFDIIRFAEKTRPIDPNFDMQRVASDFKKYDLETLSVSGLWVVARRQ